MEEILLRDSSIYPSKEVLENALREDNYKAFKKFIEIITDSGLGLTVKAAQSDPPWPVIFDHPLADLN